MKSRATSVGIVGGGIAGLACASALNDRGVSVTVFDKGRAPGGRTSSRRTEAGHVDHGAQFFRARSAEFSRVVDSWEKDGVVARWTARFLESDDAGGFRSCIRDDARWVGTPTMRAVARSLAVSIDVRPGCRILSLDRHRAGWILRDQRGEHGPFERLVLAIPAPQATELLGKHSWAADLASIHFAPCLAVAVRLPPGIDLGFDAVRLQDDSPLSWAAREGSKPGRADHGWWTLHASPAWSRAQLEERSADVLDALVGAFSSRFSAPHPDAAFAHRWRYALVERALGRPCLHDADAGLLVCGDGCLGARIEAAWASGLAAAGCLLEDPSLSRR